MIEVVRKVAHLRGGEVVKETREVQYAATDFSPREADAKTLNALFRRHWTIENKNHRVRDDHWREDRGTWRTGHTAFTMYVLLAIALNLLRAASSKWAEETPMTERSMAADHTITVSPETLLRKPP